MPDVGSVGARRSTQRRRSARLARVELVAALCLGASVGSVASAQPVGPPPAPSAPTAAPPAAPAPPTGVAQPGVTPWAPPPAPPATEPPPPPFADDPEEEETPRRRRSRPRVARPKKLAWEPGEAIPYGYEEREGPSLRFLIGGLSTAGALYVGSSIGAYITTFGGATEFAPLFVPGIGPFITIATADAENVGAFLLAIDGLGQLTGITLACLSAVVRDTWLQRIPTGVPLGDSADSSRVRVNAGLGHATIAVDF